MKILLSELTKNSIKRVLDKPPHALGIIAPTGFGKFYVAKYIAHRLLRKTTNIESQYIKFIQADENKTISIDEIRKIRSFLRLKDTNNMPIGRIVIIEDAHLMQAESQNALLKIIEEPPPQIMIILTSNSSAKLLPTIMSRLQLLPVANPLATQVYDYFADTHPKDSITKALLIGCGRVGLISALLDDQDHPLLDAILAVKTFLTQDKFSQLASLDNNRLNNALLFMEAMQTVSYSAFKQALEHNGSSLQIAKWHKLHKISTDAIADLNNKANSKLTMTNLILDM